MPASVPESGQRFLVFIDTYFWFFGQPLVFKLVVDLDVEILFIWQNQWASLRTQVGLKFAEVSLWNDHESVGGIIAGTVPDMHVESFLVIANPTESDSGDVKVWSLFQFYSVDFLKIQI